MALAHAAASRGDMGGLHRVDVALTARKLNEPARSASCLCGRQLALLAGRLGLGEVVERLSVEIEAGAQPGNLAVVEGAVGAGMGIAREETVLIAVRGHAAAMLSAAVRLGRLGTTRSQALLFELGPDLEDCAWVAMGVRLDEHAGDAARARDTRRSPRAPRGAPVHELTRTTCRAARSGELGMDHPDVRLPVGAEVGIAVDRERGQAVGKHVATGLRQRQLRPRFPVGHAAGDEH